MNHDKPGLQTG